MNITRKQVSVYLNDFNEAPGRFTEIFLAFINILACILYVFSTYPVSQKQTNFFFLSETIIISFFILEYLLRLWSSEKRTSYIFSFYGIVDLLSILPAIIPGGGGFLRVLRVFRVFRFLRFLKSKKFFFGTVSIINLQTIRVFFTIFCILFLSAGFIHYVEAHSAESSIHTFGDAFYFSVITLTTVGFGDITPVTSAGRWVTIIMIMSGIFFIPWQTGILISHFVRSEQKKREITCKQCGLMYHEKDATYCKACGSVIYQEYEG